MSSCKDLWAKACVELEKSIQPVSFDVWISKLDPVEVKDNTLILHAQNAMQMKVVIDNYAQQIIQAIGQFDPYINNVEVVNGEEALKTLQQEPVIEERMEEKTFKFNPQYTFDSFVVGDSNRFVNAAARAVSDNPGTKYNPLFIYGGVGLGKTHIMHAIGNHIMKTKPHLKTLYTTCEKFTNELIDSIRQPSKDRSHNQLFRDKYRSVDVLMIDDIQFVENKPSTQEELFHTFNELYNENKQIILTSDRMPKEIPNLEERLRTRFEWGMIADVQPPDLETKVAILQKKAEQERVSVSNEVLMLLADKVESNIREMQSLFSRVVLYANLMDNSPITPDLVAESLKDYIDSRKETLSADTIINATCKYFNISKSDVLGKKKNKEIVEPRQVAIYLISEMLSLPLASIGQIFGGRDHTTIIHARDKISDKYKTDTKTKTQINDIKSMINGV